jgi:hypothetical protein
MDRKEVVGVSTAAHTDPVGEPPADQGQWKQHLLAGELTCGVALRDLVRGAAQLPGRQLRALLAAARGPAGHVALRGVQDGRDLGLRNPR